MNTCTKLFKECTMGHCGSVHMWHSATVGWHRGTVHMWEWVCADIHRVWEEVGWQLRVIGLRWNLESGIWVYHQRSKNQIVEQSSTSLLPSLEASWTQKAFLPAADVNNFCRS